MIFLHPLKFKMVLGSSQIILENMIIKFDTAQVLLSLKQKRLIKY